MPILNLAAAIVAEIRATGAYHELATLGPFNQPLASLVGALLPPLLLGKFSVLLRDQIWTLQQGLDVFVLCRFAFRTGERVALRAADKLALVAAFVDVDELAALGNVAVDGVVGPELIYVLVHDTNHVFVENRSQVFNVYGFATSWGPKTPVPDAAIDQNVQTSLTPCVFAIEVH